jgi:diguanylate cyclase (GGDEF)-like protein
MRLFRFLSDNKLAAVLLACGLLLLAALLVGYYLQRLAEQVDERRDASGLRLTALEQTLTSMQDVQIGQGAFLLTAREDYREQYRLAQQDLSQHIAELRKLYAGDAHGAAVVEEIDRLQAVKVERLDRVLEVHRMDGLESARAMLLASSSGRHAESVRRLIEHLKAVERRGYRDLTQLLQQRRRATLHAAVGGFTITAVFGALVYLSLRRETVERRGLAQRLEYEARHDALTALPNRRSFLLELEHAVAAPRAGSRYLAVLFIDLDGFKRVNDELGHDAGDQLLRRVAELFSRSIRQGDLVARLGGDEFAALVPVATRDAAEALAERLLASLSQAAPPDHPQYGVSASIGIAVYPLDGQDGSTLLSRADSAMYRAKREGKARVHWSASREAMAALHCEG